LLNEKPKTGNPPPFLPRPFCWWKYVFNHVSFIFLKISHINPTFPTLSPTQCAP
jgi:hypothetical protein